MENVLYLNPYYFNMTSMQKPKIVVENVSKNYMVGDKKIEVLHNISFTVYEGEFISIVGPMGCGKTTLLNIISGIEKPSSGRVLIDGKEVRDVQKNMALIIQEIGIFPWMTVLENVEFGLKLRNIEKQKRLEIARNYLKLVKLDGFENYYPSQISGGMKQRVGIARAFAVDPEILLLDAPFEQLDAQTRWYLEDELKNIWSTYRKTAILATNNVQEAVYLSDRIIVLTKKPAKVKEVIEVNVPRNRTDPEFMALRVKIEELIESTGRG